VLGEDVYSTPLRQGERPQRAWGMVLCGVCGFTRFLPPPTRPTPPPGRGGAPAQAGAKNPATPAHTATNATAAGDGSLTDAHWCALVSTILLASHGSGVTMLEGFTPLFLRAHQINHAL